MNSYAIEYPPNDEIWNNLALTALEKFNDNDFSVIIYADTGIMMKALYEPGNCLKKSFSSDDRQVTIYFGETD